MRCCSGTARRRFLAAAAGVALAGRPRAAGAQGLATSRLDRILESGRLRAGTTGDFPPLTFREAGSGSFAGFDIDLLGQLALDMEVELEVVATDWNALLSGIVADRYDLTSTVLMTVQRARFAAFSAPVLEFGSVPLVRADQRDRFTGWSSFDRPDVTVAVAGGTIFAEQARRWFPNARIALVDLPAREFDEVLARRADAALLSNIEAAALSRADPALAVAPVDRLRDRRPGALLVERSDQVWRNFLNSWITITATAGRLAELETRWGLRA